MDTPIVKISEGQLKGITETNIDGEKFYSFLGIPYAQPPLGELRFKAPLPAEHWEGVRDATKEGNICYQKNDFGMVKGPTWAGSEDCLFLNVFTKTLPEQDPALKPVMVYIHGGGFMIGSGSPAMQGPGILLTEDIVLVTINYRVGALGFLRLEDPSLDVPGNAGLKDQTLALKWVQKNIKFFNGDPNNVTIFGTSAGAASVHYHILSPASKGLFHKAALHSGVALNPWSASLPEVNTFVKYLNKEPKNEKELLDILQNISVEELVEAQNKFTEEKETILRIFGPVIEKPNKTEFLTKDPIEIIVSGEYNQIPTIFGFASNEGLIEEFLAIRQKMANLPIKENKLEDHIPWQVELEPNTDAWKTVVEKMREVYQTGDNKNNKYLPPGDSLFVAGIIAAIKNHVKVQKDPVYLFILSALTRRNYATQMLKTDPKLGVSHGEDIAYFFTSLLAQDLEKGSQEDIVIRRFVKLWTNFAKYGNPTPNEHDLGITWKPVQDKTLNFLDMGNELTVGTNYAPERIELWKFIFEQNPKTALFLK